MYLNYYYLYKAINLIYVDIRIHDHYNGPKLKNTWSRLGHGNIHVKLLDYIKMNNSFIVGKRLFQV